MPVVWDGPDPAATAVDVITNPRLTPFPAAARDRGCTIVDGVEMLGQPAMQLFETWNGVTPAEEVFQRAVAEALGEQAVHPPTTASRLPCGGERTG